ncbi:MAG: PRC-barrel domain-containing protein [Candidatus Diapherotrites archaeon]|nr:PRC-barrel domain-containing protein [Candidatus Diapherotrites archaeon]
MEKMRTGFTPRGDSVKVKEILGEKVLSHSGEEIGKVKDIYLSPDSLVVEGIRIDRGLVEEDQFIGREYIQKMTKEGVILLVHPVTELEGVKVFDNMGKEIGKVKEVNRVADSNEIATLVVDRGLGKPDLIVPSGRIDHVDQNVFLNVEVEA